MDYGQVASTSKPLILTSSFSHSCSVSRLYLNTEGPYYNNNNCFLRLFTSKEFATIKYSNTEQYNLGCSFLFLLRSKEKKFCFLKPDRSTDFTHIPPPTPPNSKFFSTLGYWKFSEPFCHHSAPVFSISMLIFLKLNLKL